MVAAAARRAVDVRSAEGGVGAAVRGYIEQLVADGLLLRDGDPYPVVRLTPPARRCSRARATACSIARCSRPPKTRTRGRSATACAAAADPELFDVLREVRLRLARERGVPPYVIFHDTTLRDMAERRPATIDDLHEIYGVGARKAADFGDAFLDAIRTFRRPQA